MCLFKQDDQENSCIHEECKNYYFKSKQSCLKANIDGGEERNIQDLLLKKIQKIEPSQERDVESQQLASMQTDPNFLLNQLFLAQMMQNPAKQDFMLQNHLGMIPGLLGQFPHPQNIPFGFQDPANAGLGFANMSRAAGLGLNQLIKAKNQSNILGGWQNSSNGLQKLNECVKTETTESDKDQDNSGSSTKEFQNKLFNLVLAQNKILHELKEKHEVLEDAMKCLLIEVGQLKQTVKVALPSTLSCQTAPTTILNNPSGNPSDIMNTDTLLSYLYGPNADFQYRIVLKKDLDLPLYRERNFKFTVLLVDKNGNPVENTNRISLSLGIYSSENPPKFIESNTAGNKIFKGFTEKDLVYGAASFEKIQIREVTSHFRNGWIFFVVYPTASPNMITVNGNVNFINSQKIRPLVLEKVIVKAKRIKEKDANQELEENAGNEGDQQKEEESKSASN